MKIKSSFLKISSCSNLSSLPRIFASSSSAKRLSSFKFKFAALIFTHRFADSPTRKIVTSLIRTCDTNAQEEQPAPVGRKLKSRFRSRWPGYCTLKILAGLALAFHLSIYTLSQRIEMLGGSNLTPAPAILKDKRV